ncbi:hypothetical protein ABN702_17225 [Bacillus haimaensis]
MHRELASYTVIFYKLIAINDLLEELAKIERHALKHHVAAAKQHA